MYFKIMMPALNILCSAFSTGCTVLHNQTHYDVNYFGYRVHVIQGHAFVCLLGFCLFVLFCFVLSVFVCLFVLLEQVECKTRTRQNITMQKHKKLLKTTGK